MMLPGWVMLKGCLLLAFPTLVRAATAHLNSSLGMLKGTVLKDERNPKTPNVQVFYGIPFAKAPIGDLRFQPPQPADDWPGVKDATKMPSSCWQAIDTTFDRFPGVEMWNPNTNMSEDCLYLNAWIPVTRTHKAIMVWIYGGGFWAGTSTLSVYNAHMLAAKNDVIVISFNYRIGPLGFLYTGTSDSPGNAGLLDQVMAMKWIKANAENMGGNPDRITLFGESAGAVSVGYHFMSPLSMNLFTYGIMMSASPTVIWGIQHPDLAIKRAKSIASRLNCSTYNINKMVSCLRLVHPENITYEQWTTIRFFFDVPIGPVVDGYFLPKHPKELMADGMVKNTSMISGVVRDEGTFWVLYGFKEVFKRHDPNPVTKNQYFVVVPDILQTLGPEYASASVRKLVTMEYYDSLLPWKKPNYLDVIDDISGDLLFKCPVVEFAEFYERYTSGQVFVYSFEHRVSTNTWPQWLGVAHGYEMELFFGLPWLHWNNYTDGERKLSEDIMKMIASFAKIGEPNEVSVRSTTGWLPYNFSDQYYLVMKEDTMLVEQGLRYEPCRFWKNLADVLHLQKKEVAMKSCSGAGKCVTSLSVSITLLSALLVAFTTLQDET